MKTEQGRNEPLTNKQAKRRTAVRKKKARRRRTRTFITFCLMVLIGSAMLFSVKSFFGENPFRIKGTDDKGNQNQDALQVDGKKKFVVALDAGHGGADGGAEGYVWEIELTEATVRYLADMLTKDENYTPVLCRQDGETAENTLRRQRAQDAGAELLLSIHGNTDPGGTATGFECFPTPPERKYHDDSLRMAELIAARMGEAGQRLRGEGGVRYAYYEINRKGKYEKLVIEKSAQQPVQLESFGMLDETACPAVLIEQCFITSKTDVEQWAGKDGCTRAARIYYEAICEFFGTEPIKE
ncbi:MAG: N-acetylmuramoyl-L-alanine amidase [Oscillospiraceae bacterium]